MLFTSSIEPSFLLRIISGCPALTYSIVLLFLILRITPVK
jgi:hypothetical protein